MIIDGTFEVAIDVIIDVAGSGPRSWIRARVLFLWWSARREKPTSEVRR